MSETGVPPRRGGVDGFFDGIRESGLRRDSEHKWLAGVCSGIANRLGVDPLLVRGILIVLVTIGGVGILLYLVAWALMPDDDDRILAQEGLHGDGWGVTLLVLIGITAISNLSARWWLLLLVPVGFVAWWAIRSAHQGKTPEQMGEEAKQFANRFTGSKEYAGKLGDRCRLTDRSGRDACLRADTA